MAIVSPFKNEAINYELLGKIAFCTLATATIISTMLRGFFVARTRKERKKERKKNRKKKEPNTTRCREKGGHCRAVKRKAAKTLRKEGNFAHLHSVELLMIIK
eukprot:scaffold3595_cov235-Ochromonas_danica.AAC.5